MTEAEAMEGRTARGFLDRLQLLQSDEELRKIQRYFKTGAGEYGAGDRFIGVRMGQVFALAKEFVEMPPEEIERLLDSEIHEARAGALSIMAKQYAHRRTDDARREALYQLYLRRHDRINNWDLVDLAAWHVVGPHLVTRPRDVLYRLARSPNLWERRTAILATFSFIKRGDPTDTIAIAELLLDDPEDLIHKAAGGMLRTVGSKHRPQLKAFLDRHASRMPRTMLRYAIEHLDQAERQRYLGMKQQP
ncbi:MAG TPA: DNA alkylation repair protein [Devosiaceae bacterium]|jgi:3-methyladenine DNA glycosylase AlkD|nr:DNA alkylation repair protein [Devosiaceae bacterium]